MNLSEVERAAIRACFANGESIAWLAAQWETTEWAICQALNEGRDCEWDST